MDHELDLGRYSERVGMTGKLEPTLACLFALQKLHPSSIPFENVNCLTDDPISLNLADLEEKMVVQPRGGYCFEENGLLLQVLLQIGFKAKPHSARVLMGAPRDTIPPRAHLFITVELQGETWIVDGGFGGLSLTAPVRFVEDMEQSTPHDLRRIVRDGSSYYHQVKMGPDWMDAYQFTGEEMPLIDREMASWFVSTGKDSFFRQMPICALALPDGERIGLLDKTFTHRRGSEVLRQFEIQDADHLVKILSAEFGVQLPAGTKFPRLAERWANSS